MATYTDLEPWSRLLFPAPAKKERLRLRLHNTSPPLTTIVLRIRTTFVRIRLQILNKKIDLIKY